jgi:hypothetical protein
VDQKRLDLDTHACFKGCYVGAPAYLSVLWWTTSRLPCFDMLPRSVNSTAANLTVPFEALLRH